MTLTDLGVLYAVAGAVSGVAAYRRAPPPRARALGSAALAVMLWPLWLPVLLSSGARRHESEPEADPDCATETALLEAHAVVRDGPLEDLLPRAAVERILGEVRRARARKAELDGLLAAPSYDPEQAEARLERLIQDSASRRTLTSARLHLDNVRRLAALAERDRRALGELEELVMALRTQLVLAKFAGTAPSDAGDIVAEVWARVEVLGTTLDTPLAPPDPDLYQTATP
jgi:hypothetical protein